MLQGRTTKEEEEEEEEDGVALWTKAKEVFPKSSIPPAPIKPKDPLSPVSTSCSGSSRMSCCGHRRKELKLWRNCYATPPSLQTSCSSRPPLRRVKCRVR
jgi:hypothetical protein